jgi:hypothetical protein
MVRYYDLNKCLAYMQFIAYMLMGIIKNIIFQASVVKYRVSWPGLKPVPGTVSRLAALIVGKNEIKCNINTYKSRQSV